MSVREPALSAHGGALPVDEQLIRAQARAKLFGSAGPLMIGRFRIERQIGVGGMGRVYAAYDDELGRTVALKIVLQLQSSDSTRQRARILREARSLAQLSHPNVVGVHEVGPFEDGLYIAMEYVDGQTLREWLADETRSWDQIVAKFTDAGRGLAAAHRKGIVHRDFKLDNVLLDHEDERPRVADFGLARTGGASQHDRRATDEAGIDSKEEFAVTISATAQSGSLQTPALTSVGARLGTPDYMAPEHLRGAEATRATDQYSFCVSLHEALFGFRPRQQPNANEAVRGTPRRIRQALTRGLADNPEDRWPNMDALLAQLAPRRVRRGRWLMGAVAVAAPMVWWFSPSDCERAKTQIWDEARDGVGARFESADLSYVASSWPTVSSGLDRYVTRWNDESVAACRSESSRPAYQARSLDCLQQRHDELRYLVGRLSAGDEAAVATAASEMARLPDPEVCNSDVARARWHVPADARSQATREEARSLLREARQILALSQTTAGTTGFADRVTVGVTVAREALAIAQEGGHKAAELDAQHTLAELCVQAGQLQEAEDLARQTADAAVQIGDSAAMVRALSLLAPLVGTDPQRYEEALTLIAQATAALDSSTDDAVTRARLGSKLGTILGRTQAPRFAEALSHHREALFFLRSALGPDHPETLQTQLELGETLTRAGDSADALSNLRGCLAGADRAWGVEHPRFAAVERMLALALAQNDDVEEALPHFAHALAVNERALGHERAEITQSLFEYASALRQLNRPAEATDLLRRGISIVEVQHGHEHPAVVPWLVMLGRCELELSREQDAQRNLQRAMVLHEFHGASAVVLAETRVLLARAVAGEDPNRARRLALESRTLYAGAPEHYVALVEVDRFVASLGDWLLSVDSNTYELVRIDTADGTTTPICVLSDDGARYSSAAFAPDGTLFVTYKVDATDDASVRLATIDPCTCERKGIARFGVMGVSGLVWTRGTLYGISHGEDLLMSIDPKTGTRVTIGKLDVDIHNNGASGSDRDGTIYVLDGRADALFEIEAATARTRRIAAVSLDTGAIGLEMHPASGRLFACTDDAVLYEIDPNDGTVSTVGNTGLAGKCSALGAPKGPVRCIDEPA